MTKPKTGWAVFTPAGVIELVRFTEASAIGAFMRTFPNQASTWEVAKHDGWRCVQVTITEVTHG